MTISSEIMEAEEARQGILGWGDLEEVENLHFRLGEGIGQEERNVNRGESERLECICRFGEQWSALVLC